MDELGLLTIWLFVEILLNIIWLTVDIYLRLRKKV